jgi:hypothetical protein
MTENEIAPGLQGMKKLNEVLVGGGAFDIK